LTRKVAGNALMVERDSVLEVEAAQAEVNEKLGRT
jgi:hypothetical protein